ncbi:MAG: nucleotide exchange factor GrpE [Candidatus Neomarinimicrobiota bacterium]|nr:nucleotide exchange factor GrpE [Candidatus Neomarinimicrobiota bacterium]
MAEKKSVKTKKQTIKNKKPKDQKKSNNNNIQIQLDQLQDKHIRLKAEFENFRKRKNKEISALLQYDGEGVIRDILPIIDDIERMVKSALKTDTDNEKSLIEGMNILKSKIQRFLEIKNIEPFGKEGEVLDPELHDAMLTQKDDKKEDNTVLSVFEKGYRYHDKVIRHAKVVVNKK